jgi:hypothetical protein
MAQPLTRGDVALEISAVAAELEQLRHDPRDPSALILGKIDIERRLRRLSRRLSMGA